jgi:enamine deaminase RidA (YjgF/YER057c/UK114 family)
VISSAIDTTPPHPAASSASAARGKGLKRQTSPGADLTLAEHDGVLELHITLRPLPGERPAATVQRLAQLLCAHRACVVRQEVFGSLAARDEVLQTLRAELGEICWPVTYVEGQSCAGEPLAGLHVLAVAGAAVKTVSLGGSPVGRIYRDASARYLLLGDVRPSSLSLSKADQARQAYEALEEALRAGDMDMPNLARTWLFLDDVLAWYGPFNEVRTTFYRERGVFERMVPASTGVSGRNAPRAALVTGAWAVEGLQDGFCMREVASPRQCPAPAYGSSFSRAVELLTPALRRVMVSGTASIEPGGASVGGGDVEAQIDLTMEVVRAILVSRELDFPEVSRATAYFKRAEDIRSFDLWRGRYSLQSWPVVCTVADICREELLFEIEVDALGLVGSLR